MFKQLDFEQLLAQRVAEFKRHMPEYDALIESDPVYKVLQASAYRELTLREQFNQRAKGVFLAYAQRGDLDNLAAPFGVTRKQLTPADPEAGTPAEFETDTEFRRRIQLAPEGLSVAGPEAKALARKLATHAASGELVPEALRDKPEASLIYRNLPDILARPVDATHIADDAPLHGSELIGMAMKIDAIMRTDVPAGWKGNAIKGRAVQRALLAVVDGNREATIKLYELVKKPSRLPMMDAFLLGDIEILVTRKDVKNIHPAEHPPEGRVTLVAPMRSRLDVLRAYAITRLGWIRKQQTGFRAQAREAPRRHVTRESHSVLGRRYLLDVQIVDAKPGVRLDHKRITLSVRPGTDEAKRSAPK